MLLNQSDITYTELFEINKCQLTIDRSVQQTCEKITACFGRMCHIRHDGIDHKFLEDIRRARTVSSGSTDPQKSPPPPMQATRWHPDSFLSKGFRPKLQLTESLIDLPEGPPIKDSDDLFKYFKKYTIQESDRKELWRKAIGNKLRLSKRSYAELEARIDSQGVPKDVFKVIINDLDRTFPECDSRSEGVRMYQDIVKILSLFAVYRPDVGYVQGMSYIASNLYFLFDPFESFVLFSNLIICNRLMLDLYSMDAFRVSFQ